MRNKKGFTLIELLAVILILAIIALVTVPIVLNMIENARRKAAIDTAYGYIQAVEYAIDFSDANIKEYENIKINDQEYDIKDEALASIKIKGKKPDSGTITIDKRKVVYADLCISKYEVEYQNNEAKIVKSNKCKGGEEEVVVKDETPCELATETVDSKEVYYIDSVEDFYAFTNLVNEGTNFSGQVVKLRNNLDFSGYTPEKKNKICGKDNNGYTPIGSYSNPFKGTFEGNAKTIKNVTINRPEEDNIGIFGGVEGTVRGLIVDNAKITGHNNVSVVAGYVNHGGSINDIIIKNMNVSGNNNVGAIAGALDNQSNMNNIVIKSGTINSSGSTGIVSGYFYYSDIGSVALDDVKINYGSSLNEDHITYLMYSDKYKVNGTTPDNATNGINDLNAYEAYDFDTWIGMDNDNSGYYFDYKDSSSNEITLKRVDSNTFKINLDGEGTEANPYLIKNEDDWKTATLIVNNNKSFKLTKDLNFSSKHFYMMGSGSNEFKGNFYGGAYTIANAKVSASNIGSAIGVFGAARKATIQGLILKNISLHSYSSVGTLVGYAWENVYVKEILIDNCSVTGVRNGYVGSVAGAFDNYSDMDTVIIRNVTLKSPNRVGVVTGYNYASPVNYVIVENMNVTASSVSEENTNYLRISNNATINGTKKTDGFDPANNNDINFYAACGLDTWIGGDLNNSKYYVDYDDNGIITIKSIERHPLTFDLAGSGTKSSPYLIKNETDWKKMTLKLGQSNIYFKLTNDLNFKNKKYYTPGLNMHGIYTLPFKGVIDGGAHTIKNIKINAEGIGHVGIFGDLSGAYIYGFNITDSSVTAGGTSGVFSYVNYSSTVREIALDNITINNRTGSTYGAIVAGALDNQSTIDNILVKRATLNGGEDMGFSYGYYYYSTASNMIFERANINSSGTHQGGDNIYYSNACKINGSAISGFDSSNIDKISYYSGKIETPQTGDTNNTGYYFNYDSAKNGVYLVKANN